MLTLLSGTAAGVATGQVGEDPSQSLGTGTLGTRLNGSLDYRSAGALARGAVSREPSPVRVTEERLAEYVKLPEFRSTAPRFGYVRLARQGKTHLAIDQARPDLKYYDLLYIDRNNNLDFTDDGPPVAGKSLRVEARDRDYTEFTDITLDLYYRKGVIEPYSFTLYAWYPRSGPLTEFLMSASSWREGVIEIEGTPMRVALFDEDNNGSYDLSGGSWALERADEDAALLLDPEFRRSLDVPIRVNSVPYRVAAVFDDGRVLELESETEFNTRKAERRNDLTLSEPPFQPGTESVLWTDDLDQALKDAARERRLVFLLFTVDWSRSAVKFNERTLRDRRVVDALENYICVRVNPDLAPGLEEEYGVAGCPTSVIIGSNGQVLETMLGYRQASLLVNELRRRR